jgi:hypothetical protein
MIYRIDIGGKLLTNHLKELISFRQWYMMDQTPVMNNIKELCCFVARDFEVELQSWKFVTTFILIGRINSTLKPFLHFQIHTCELSKLNRTVLRFARLHACVDREGSFKDSGLHQIP